jgi:hypothetical protein
VLVGGPTPIDFGQVPIGIGTSIRQVTVTNTGNASGQLLTELGGEHPGDFYVHINGCNERVLAPQQSCTIDVMMIAVGGGDRSATLTISSGTAATVIELRGQGRFLPRVMASPGAITVRGITTIIGRGFPPGGTFDVEIGGTGHVVTATADPTGAFRIPFTALGTLELGNYVLEVDALASVFDVVRGQLVVVLSTFEPQGPGGPAFGEALIVTRGG